MYGDCLSTTHPVIPVIYPINNHLDAAPHRSCARPQSEEKQRFRPARAVFGAQHRGAGKCFRRSGRPGVTQPCHPTRLAFRRNRLFLLYIHARAPRGEPERIVTVWIRGREATSNGATMSMIPKPGGPAARNTRAEEDFERALRPNRLGEFIGQQKIKDNLQVFLTAALQRGEALDHVLLSGPPGLGKCITADSLILTSRGLVPFSEILPPGMEAGTSR